ncbi:hypothetical protein AD929_07155 [Gluconobacter potus]|uniref:Uncharacterized protein n=1 Tax=Gluconobacter potus TaxID=2724927 RepID=A0A149QVT3_9PROT|nr:hypothetical protein AD929_07155 [Gluconobacter potus]
MGHGCPGSSGFFRLNRLKDKAYHGFREHSPEMDVRVKWLFFATFDLIRTFIKPEYYRFLM